MSLIPVIIDQAVAYPHMAPGSRSLCSLPLGCGTILDHLLTRLKVLGTTSAILLPTVPMGQAYPRQLRQNDSPTLTLKTPEEFGHHVASCETGDFVLLIDPRRWPAAGYNLEGVAEMLRSYRAVTHVVGIRADKENIREVVDCADDGRIRRLQRLYDTVLWPEAASTSIAYSLVPAQAMVGMNFLSLAQLRRDLSARGALSRDLLLASDIVDLADETAYLSINDKLIATWVDDPPNELSVRAPGILVGMNCRIHPSARLVAPIVMQTGVIVEEDVTVVGPVLLGAGSRLRKGATVAQAVLASRADVDPKATVLHQVVAGHCSGDMSHESYWSESSWDTAGIRTKETDPAKVTDFHVGQRCSRRVHFLVKRLLDILLSLVALIILSPLFIVVALLIKLDSRGPVLFRHPRESRNGKEFPCYKFRTMKDDAHRLQRELYRINSVDGPQFKLRHDPRVTRIGNWLRATNIDELPQLFNVLLGHMSLVGPRPSPFRENQICIPWRQARLSVRPGITGLWQICRDDRAGGGFHQWIFYDIAYVRHFSIWLDVKILFATLFSLSGRWPIPVSWLVHEPRRISVYSS